MPRIVLRTIGAVSENTSRCIVDTVEECYQRLEPHTVELLANPSAAVLRSKKGWIEPSVVKL